MRPELQFGAVPQSHYSGHGLLEVLVAALLLSFGVLASARMQGLSTASQLEAEQRSLAAHLASDLLARFRNAGITPGSPKASTTSDATGEPAHCASDPRCEIQRQWERLRNGDQLRIDGMSMGGLIHPSTCIAATPAEPGVWVDFTIAWRGANAIFQPGDWHASANGCGRGAVDASGNPLYGVNDEYRRLHTIGVYLTSMAPD